MKGKIKISVSTSNFVGEESLQIIIFLGENSVQFFSLNVNHFFLFNLSDLVGCCVLQNSTLCITYLSRDIRFYNENC